jgi:phosphoribosylanthranilate isomerase
MDKDTPEQVEEAAPVVDKLVDVNTGVEVAPVPAGFDAHIIARGLDKPCEEC